MAQRRMFSLAIIDTDRFLEMPTSAQALYFHLGMRADDEGFVSSPRKITSLAGCAADDLKLLITKGFIIPFDSGVCVVTNWKQNNFIRSDRFHSTQYHKEKAMLTSDQDGVYILSGNIGIPNDNQMSYQWDTEVRLELGKSKDREATASCAELSVDADTPRRNIVLTLTLNDKSEYPVCQKQISEWAELYPAVDVIQQLRNMKGWLNANPTKRKTKTGILTFINGWLAREQNKGGHAPSPANSRMAPSHQKNYDEEFR